MQKWVGTWIYILKRSQITDIKLADKVVIWALPGAQRESIGCQEGAVVTHPPNPGPPDSV